MTGSPRVFTVVLNHRTPDDTVACARSLRQSTYRMQFPVVVDNGSGPATVRRLREELFPWTVLDTGENLGYAGGNNVGIRHALERDADLVWILNPDTTVEPDALGRLVATARRNPQAGLLGGRVLYGGSRPLTVASDGGFLRRDDPAHSGHLHDGQPDAEVPADSLVRPDFVTGSCMLVRSEVLRTVGLLPEEYFLYFEETDYALQVRDAGWQLLVDPRARVHHFKRSSGPLPTATYVYYYVRGRFLFDARHSENTPEETLDDLDHFVSTWRERVAARAPGWLETYDRLVGWAVEDGHTGRGGRRDRVHEVEGPDGA